MSQYKYDEEGGQFLTFVLTFLLLVLLPLTYSLFPSNAGTAGKQGWFDSKGQKNDQIKRAKRRTLTNPQISSRLLLVLLGWAAVAYLVQRIANTAANSSHTIYDPFSILGIAASATEKEIKKHYKRLSVKFHPDKLVLGANDTKESAESHYIELTKAYKALTDETVRKNFELYGHPDGRQEMSMGIALPTWVVESQNNIWVLGAYGLVFGLGLPYITGRWWYGSRSKTKDGVINSTAQTFFQYLREDTPAPRVVELIAVSEEFRNPVLDQARKSPDDEELNEIEKDIRKRLEPGGPRWEMIDEFRTPSIRKATLLIYAHLLRIDTKSVTLTKEKYRFASKSAQLLNGLLSMSLAHNWLDETVLLMNLVQNVVQATPIADRTTAELLQLPGMNAGRVQALRKAHKLAAYGIQGFWNIPDAERKKTLEVGNKGLGQSEYDQMVRVAGEWPRLEMVDAFFKVSGERLVTTGAIVQFVVKLRLLPSRKDSALLRDGERVDSPARDEETSVRPGTSEEDEVDLDSLIGRTDRSKDKEGKQPIGFARAPHFLDERKPHWWVMIGDHKLNRVIVQPTRMTDIGPDAVRTYTVQFQAPPQAGLYTFQAIVKSDSYLGSDATRHVKLKVDDPSALNADDVEDEISDPEEDSLAGQMAAMRGGKVKPARREEDEEESDDESGTEESEEESEGDSDSDSDSD